MHLKETAFQTLRRCWASCERNQSTPIFRVFRPLSTRRTVSHAVLPPSSAASSFAASSPQGILDRQSTFPLLGPLRCVTVKSNGCYDRLQGVSLELLSFNLSIHNSLNCELATHQIRPEVAHRHFDSETLLYSGVPFFSW